MAREEEREASEPVCPVRSSCSWNRGLHPLIGYAAGDFFILFFKKGITRYVGNYRGIYIVDERVCFSTSLHNSSPSI